MKVLRFFLSFASLLLAFGIAAQVPASAPTTIDQVELRERLRARGIELDSLDAEELAAVQPDIEAVIAEMEAERVVPPAAPPPSPAPVADENADSEETEAKEEEDNPGIWGHQVFRSQNLEVYQTTDNVRPPDSYQLGVGDAVAISIFGASEADLKFIIDNSGFIRPPGMPRIYLKGIPLGRAEELVRDRFANYYSFREGQFSFSLDEARTITVNIFGETESNGSFTLSAVNTAFNALVAAGGPTEGASVRQIKLLRNGEERMIDIYEFLMDPNRSPDIFLENNDVIFVPLAQTVVSIEGGVRRPMRYEMLSGETTEDLVRYAGGAIPGTVLENATLLRVEGDRETVLNAGLGEEKEALLLQSGDQVQLPSGLSRQRAYVGIAGDVMLSGEYELIPGMRMSDLIRTGRLRPSSRRDVAFFRRVRPNGTATVNPVSIEEILSDPSADSTLENQDQLLVLNSADYVNRSYVAVKGAVRDSINRYPYSADSSLTVADVILLAGGLTSNASTEAFLIRDDPENEDIRQYVRLDLSTSAALSTVLRPNDELRVYKRERFTDSFPVSVRGAVRNPGQFTYDPSLGLTELFVLAGGLKFEAARNKVDVFRLEISQTEGTQTRSATLQLDENLRIVGGDTDYQLRPFDVIVVRSVPEFELIRIVTINGEVRYPGDYPLDTDNLRLSELIAKAGGLTKEAFPSGAKLIRERGGAGFVVVRLDKALTQPGSIDDIILREGDEIRVPKVLDLVAIRPGGTRALGAYDPSLFADGSLDVTFLGARSAKWYINNYAAGFNKLAKRRTVTVQYPNGRLARTKKILWFNNYPEVRPGSLIQMELKEPKPPRVRASNPVDWLKVGQAIGGIGTTLLTLVILADRLRN